MIGLAWIWLVTWQRALRSGDPFIGSGTVGAVAERLGRRWVGTDLSYQDLAKKRTAQAGLRFGA